jgi:hypothetical protein
MTEKAVCVPKKIPQDADGFKKCVDMNAQTCVDPSCQWTNIDNTAVKPTGTCKENNVAGTVSIMTCFNFITETTCPATCIWEPFTTTDPVFVCRGINAASTQHCEKIDLKDTCYESGPNGELCEWADKNTPVTQPTGS